MPTYEYVCSKCDHAFEVSQSIMSDPLTICPKDQCGMKRWGKGKVSRRISGGAGLLFKGTGFYITDYRSEGYKADKAKAEPKPAKTEGKAKEGESGTKSSGKTKGKETGSGGGGPAGSA